MCLRLALIAPVVAAGRVGHLKGWSEQTSLATNSTEDSLVYTGVNNAIEMFTIRAPKAPAADAGAGAGKAKQPVGVQVDEKVMNNLEKDLSPACSKRYTAMMQGKGPEMHTFNEHNPKDAKGDQCEKELQGAECQTLARMTESQQVPDGRKMTAKTKVAGMSCLPKECTSQEDLSVLATFMHKQTKEIFPDERIKVALHVDCSASGGAVVDANGGEAEVAPKVKSGAIGAMRMAPLLSLVFLLFA